jgi:hypothetical protein
MKQKITIRASRHAILESLGTSRIVDHDPGYATDILVEEIVIDAESVVVEELEKFVTVEFLDPHPRLRRLTHELYTYKDSTQDGLQVGDLVKAPTVYEPLGARAIVRSTKPNIPTTHITKSIVDRNRLFARTMVR